MSLFNRIALVLVCAVLLVAAVAVIVLTWTIPNRSINWLSDAVDWIDANDGDLEKALLTTISATIGLFAVIVLLLELFPRSGPDVKVTDLSRGDATLSTAAIGQRIEEAVCQVPNVAEVRANVRARKRGVLVSLDLQVDPEANLATVTDEACRVAQDVLTDRVHVALLRPPTARLHYRELRLHGRGNGTFRRPARAGTTTAPMSPPPEPPRLPPSLAPQHPSDDVTAGLAATDDAAVDTPVAAGLSPADTGADAEPVAAGLAPAGDPDAPAKTTDGSKQEETPA